MSYPCVCITLPLERGFRFRIWEVFPLMFDMDSSSIIPINDWRRFSYFSVFFFQIINLQEPLMFDLAISHMPQKSNIWNLLAQWNVQGAVHALVCAFLVISIAFVLNKMVCTAESVVLYGKSFFSPLKTSPDELCAVTSQRLSFCHKILFMMNIGFFVVIIFFKESKFFCSMLLHIVTRYIWLSSQHLFSCSVTHVFIYECNYVN